MDNENVSPQPEVVDNLPVSKLQKMAQERIALISKEFMNGYNFIEDYPKSVTIFGGSHFKENSPYYHKARELAGRIAKELEYAVFTGGGPGLMEAANRGAYEAGGQSLGLTIELVHEQPQNKYLTKKLNFYYFFSRKVCMSFSAEAYIFFPGGFGTLDEFFEIVTLVQTDKIEPLPIILIGSDFWEPFNDFLRNELLSRGTVEKKDLQLYIITDDLDEVIDLIRQAPVRNGVVFRYKEPSAGID